MHLVSRNRCSVIKQDRRSARPCGSDHSFGPGRELLLLKQHASETAEKAR